MEHMPRIKLRWKAFCDACRDGDPLPCDVAVRARLNRFRARFLLATRLESIEARGYSAAALRGYGEGVRLLAAYSAAELLGEAIDQKITSWEMIEPQLAQRLRKTLGRACVGQDLIFSAGGLRAKLMAFMDGHDDDVRVAATALRVMVAHGSFTPTGTDAMSRAGALTLAALCQRLQDESVKRFNDWLVDVLAKNR